MQKIEGGDFQPEAPYPPDKGFILPFGPETSGSKERIHPEGDTGG
jgi:hypothetical protein